MCMYVYARLSDYSARHISCANELMSFLPPSAHFSSLRTAGKHVQLTETVGFITVAFDIRAESYWEDSESEGTATNSNITTPASTAGSVRSAQRSPLVRSVNHTPVHTPTPASLAGEF